MQIVANSSLADPKHLQQQKSDDDDDNYDLEGPEDKGSKSWVPAIEDPNYFEVLTSEEIYDSFFSIKRMGFIANRIIRKLNDTKHIVTSKILEKRKKLRLLQRKQFETLSPAGAEYLKVLLKMGKKLKKIVIHHHLILNYVMSRGCGVEKPNGFFFESFSICEMSLSSSCARHQHIQHPLSYL